MICICERCRGTGKTRCTSLHSVDIWALLPCLECTGSGVTSCGEPHDNPGERTMTDDHLHCSFCGKPREDVRHLLQGPVAYCCDECVGLMHSMIAEVDRDGREISPKPPRPVEEFRRDVVASLADRKRSR